MAVSIFFYYYVPEPAHEPRIVKVRGDSAASGSLAMLGSWQRAAGEAPRCCALPKMDSRSWR